MNDVISGSDWLGFLEILNKSSELRVELRRSELIIRIWARRDQFVDGGVRVRVGWVSVLRADDGRTVSIIKIVSLSPRVENLNLKKVIKVSYLNQDSRQCFACFSDSSAYEHYERFIHPYILHIRILNMLHIYQKYTCRYIYKYIPKPLSAMRYILICTHTRTKLKDHKYTYIKPCKYIHEHAYTHTCVCKGVIFVIVIMIRNRNRNLWSNPRWMHLFSSPSNPWVSSRAKWAL